jgi:hypothetical protein
VKDGEHDSLKDRVLEDLAVVEQKERIVKIIHETYVKELQRVKE